MGPALCIAAIWLCCAGEGRAWEIDGEKVAEFAVGTFAGLLIHEGSHWIVAQVKGEDIEFHGLTRSDRKDGGRLSDTVRLAGLVGNAISSEVLLRIPPERRKPLHHGILALNMVEQIQYPLLDYNDYDLNLDMPPGEKAAWVSGFVLQAGCTAYRLDKDGQLSPKAWVGKDRKGHTFLAERADPEQPRVWVGRLKGSPALFCQWEW